MGSMKKIDSHKNRDSVSTDFFHTPVIHRMQPRATVERLTATFQRHYALRVFGGLASEEFALESVRCIFRTHGLKIHTGFGIQKRGILSKNAEVAKVSHELF